MGDPELKARERHNASADEEIIDKGACGQKHLATGRACIRPTRHDGSCDFRSPSEVQAVAAGEAPPLDT
ncbi:MAG: hypothetical protein ABIM89_14320 [Mycobacteriales bacterium]